MFLLARLTENRAGRHIAGQPTMAIVLIAGLLRLQLAREPLDDAAGCPIDDLDHGLACGYRDLLIGASGFERLAADKRKAALEVPRGHFE